MIDIFFSPNISKHVLQCPTTFKLVLTCPDIFPIKCVMKIHHEMHPENISKWENLAEKKVIGNES